MSTPAALRRPARRFGPARRSLFATCQRSAALLGGRRYYRARHLARGRFRIRRERVELDRAHAAFDGYRIVQLSDPHAGPFLARGDLAPVVAAANALAPDLVAITGDLSTDHPDQAFELLEDFARLEARDGKFAVCGNHDYLGRRERQIAARFEREAGVRFLFDANVRLSRGASALALVGLEDLEEARSLDLDQARRGVDPDDLEVVLCHNPAGADALAGHGPRLVLSGHTHGHQIDLPWVRRLAPRHPGDRRDLAGTVAITNRGLGALGVPLRVRSPAELVCVEFARGAGGDRGAR